MKNLRLTTIVLFVTSVLSFSTPALAKESESFDLTTWFGQLFTTRTGTGKPIEPK